MTEEIVLDTSVFVTYLIDEDKLDADDKRQRPLAITYIDGLETGDYLVHLPMIAVVEIVGITRQKAGAGPAIAIKNRLEQWATLGLIRLHDLDETRMRSATDLVIQHNLSRHRSLSAPDATFIGLAEELGVNVVTFEEYFRSVSPRAVVPV